MSAAAIRKLAKTPPKDSLPTGDGVAPQDNWLSWLQSPQADKLSQAAEGKAWNAFLAKYPNVDKSKFVAQTDFDDNRKATAEIYFKESPASRRGGGGQSPAG